MKKSNSRYKGNNKVFNNLFIIMEVIKNKWWRPKKKHPWWRPSKMNNKIVEKLEEWFAMWFTDLEACLYAWISKDVLYNYIKKNPNFKDRKELLKHQPKLKAKMNITKSINQWDKNDSKWYLERKSKDEFSLKQEIDQTTKTVEVELTENQKKKIAERLLDNK